jgi:flagellin-like hook-associated protein FlgL
MTAINTNVGALNARLYTLNAGRAQETAMERLSSGSRVNSAADDAAGLAVAGKMESQLRGINMAIRNNQDGVGLIQTAESGLNEIRNMVLRIRELAVQMANGIYENTPDRSNAQLEVTALLNQVDLIADNTKFNDLFQASQFKQVIQQQRQSRLHSLIWGNLDFLSMVRPLLHSRVLQQLLAQWTLHCRRSLRNKLNLVRIRTV